MWSKFIQTNVSPIRKKTAKKVGFSRSDPSLRTNSLIYDMKEIIHTQNPVFLLRIYFSLYINMNKTAWRESESGEKRKKMGENYICVFWHNI